MPATRASQQRALAINEAVYGPDHPEVARTLGNLGLVQQWLRELPSARASVERALATFNRALGPEHPERRSWLPRSLLSLMILKKVSEKRSFSNMIQNDAGVIGFARG